MSLTNKQGQNLIKWGFTGDPDNLEQLLEFAKKKVYEVKEEQLWLFTMNGGWAAFCKREMIQGSQPDPKQAVYKLLEKVMEKP